MLASLTLILVFQLLGEATTLYFDLPAPGPVVGMAYFLIYLGFRRGPTTEEAAVGKALLERLSLLFVPAGVGVTLHLTVIEAKWRALGAALVVSTAIGVAATALAMVAFARRRSTDRAG